MAPCDESDVPAELAAVTPVGAAEWIAELERAPDVPAQAREELVALKSGGMFVCTRMDGDIRPARSSGEGLYAQDTRHLSELTLMCGGTTPVLLSAATESGHHAVINATNPSLVSADGAIVPQETLNVQRTLLIGDRLFVRVTVRNYSRAPVATELGVALAADFADVFEVRGLERQTTGTVLAPGIDEGALRFGYVAADGERRETLVELTPAPAEMRIDGARVGVVWDLDLDPGAAAMFQITVTPRSPGSSDSMAAGGRRSAGHAAERTTARASAAHDEWVGSCARIVSDRPGFDRLIDASLRDLHALLMEVGGERLPAAGIPWYVAPFGRDSLLTGCETLMINPDVARGTLLVLANLQARVEEAWRDAEPGKILHELRGGELARTDHIPHTPYYGTVDATPLFLMVAGGYFRWTLDLETMRRLRPAFDAALEWIDRWGDRDGDGFVEYERRAPAGLVNHGWKDSHDSIVHRDGSLAEGPIALVEVQGYVYEAKRRIADVYDAMGDAPRATRLREEARVLRVAFNEAFWDSEEGFFALALDGAKQRVASVTSNPAHCLYCGIIDEDKAPLVAERLMAPDMFSGWGIRTLSSDSPAYNPMSYHNGSVWPHDNAIAAAGLKRYGFADGAVRVASALFEVAADARDLRLPELFCGFDRYESRAIVPYPVACIPQAWAAAAPFMLLQAVLGISARAPDNQLTVEQPRLPDWLSSVEIDHVRIGQTTVGLAFRRAREGTAFSLLRQDGDARVIMSA